MNAQHLSRVKLAVSRILSVHGILSISCMRETQEIRLTATKIPLKFLILSSSWVVDAQSFTVLKLWTFKSSCWSMNFFPSHGCGNVCICQNLLKHVSLLGIYWIIIDSSSSEYGLFIFRPYWLLLEFEPLYSGDTDSVVPVTATRYSMDALKLPTLINWYPWYDSGKVSVENSYLEFPMLQPSSPSQLTFVLCTAFDRLVDGVKYIKV